MEQLSRCVITVKYAEAWKGWKTEVVRGSHGVGLWKNI